MDEITAAREATAREIAHRRLDLQEPAGRQGMGAIDAAGCRARIGGAQVSEQHCNFLINTAMRRPDIEALGEEVRRRVRETASVELEWEIKRLGRPK
ncbi:MAG: hypothetical protein U1E87_01895 [Alphaproteobacteria bacterium]